MFRETKVDPEGILDVENSETVPNNWEESFGS